MKNSCSCVYYLRHPEWGTLGFRGMSIASQGVFPWWKDSQRPPGHQATIRKGRFPVDPTRNTKTKGLVIAALSALLLTSALTTLGATPLSGTANAAQAAETAPASPIVTTGHTVKTMPDRFMHLSSTTLNGVCQADGSRLVTGTGSTNSVPASGPGHTADLTFNSVTPAGTTLPASQVVVGNDNYTFSYSIVGTATSTSIVTDFLWGDGHHENPTASKTFAGACIAKDASATKVETKETCSADSSIQIALVFASIDPAYVPLPASVGSHTVPVIADAGHQFANGTANDTVTYVIVAADPSLCPQDASATKVVTVETCTADSTVTIDTVFASVDAADLPLPTSVGSHTVHVTADAHHLFTSTGTMHDTVTYTIVAADPTLCPHDASWTLTETSTSCNGPSTASITVVNGHVDPADLPLPTSVGSHTVGVIADAYHLFITTGTAVDTVTYTIKAALSGATNCPLYLGLTGTGFDPRPTFVVILLAVITLVLFRIRWTREHWMLPAVRWIVATSRRLYYKVIAAVKTA
jgi:hypothetical protein